MSSTITAATRVYAVLGDPVHHSLSPPMQNAAFREAGVDGVYVALRCGPEACTGLIRALARAGGGGNVTLPHKSLAASVVDLPSGSVVRTGACNTFWEDGGVIHGDNTDVEGFSRAVETLMGARPENASVLLLGAGGAARAVTVALLDGGVRVVTIANRSTPRARVLASVMEDDRVRVLNAVEDALGGSYDLLVNATSLGLRPTDPAPMSLGQMGAVGWVLDLVYAPDGTALVREARSRGIPAADGTEMLVQQGAAAFRRWWGNEPCLEAMRRAVLRGGRA